MSATGGGIPGGAGPQPQPSALHGVIWLASVSYATLFLGFLTGPILARALGPSGRGAVASVLVYSGLVATVLGLGVSTAVIHALRNGRQSEREIVGALVRFASALMPFSLIAAVLVASFVLPPLGRAEPLGFAFVAFAPLAVLGLCLISVLLARGELEKIAQIRAVSGVLTALAVIGLALGGALSTTSFLLLLLISGVGVLGFTVALVRVPPSRRGSLAPLLRFGMRAYPGSLANVANFQLDQALIAPFLGTTQLGYYAISVTLSSLPLSLSGAIGSRIYGAVGVDPAGNIDLQRTARVLRLSVAAAAIVAAGLAAAAPIGLPLLYGSAFEASIVPLLLLLPGMVAASAGSVAEAALVLLGRPGTNSRAEAVALLTTVVGLLAFLGPLGIVGAALTTSAAYGLRAAIQLRALRRLGELRWWPGVAELQRLSAEASGIAKRFAARLSRS
jgi:O-antigen/teichoic acid export membrane protein